MKNKVFSFVKSFLVFVVMAGVMAIAITVSRSNALKDEQIRKAGTMKFLYKAGDCNVYELHDGLGGNMVLVPKCGN